MERCPRCGKPSFQPRRGCAHCGAAAMASPAEAERMLVHANLLRMRGLWEQAADECVEVLRLDPTNATAHSLLGDIYQDQGRATEARHWYQLALEMNPSSEADRAKLARADETLEARKQRAEWEAVIEGRSQPVATSLLLRESLQRVVALAGAALCGILLVMATLVSVSEHGPAGADDDTSPNWIRRLAHRKAVAIVPETRHERDIQKKMLEMATGAAAQLVRVEVDPRAHSGRLRLYLSDKVREKLTTPSFRSLVMQEAYRFALALHQTDHQLTVIRVDVVGPSGPPAPEPNTDLLFSGTLRVDDLVVPADTVLPKELETFFARVDRPLWATELIPY